MITKLCDPDYNVYTGDVHPKPEGAATNLRSAGFHIHLGYDNFNTQTSLLLIRYLDMYLGIPSVVYDRDTERRSLYGKAGSFRLQPWGLEWRSMSSAMQADEEKLNIVWTGIQNAIYAYNHGLPLIDSEVVMDVINNGKLASAKRLIKKYNLLAPLGE